MLAPRLRPFSAAELRRLQGVVSGRQYEIEAADRLRESLPGDTEDALLLHGYMMGLLHMSTELDKGRNPEDLATEAKAYLSEGAKLIEDRNGR